MTAGFLNRRQVLVTGTPVLAGSTLASTRNGTVHVTIDKLAFLPAEIEVKAGETIDWTNKDPVAHTPTVKGGWDALIPPGKMATSVAAAADTGEYYCRFHPNLKGRSRWWAGERRCRAKVPGNSPALRVVTRPHPTWHRSAGTSFRRTGYPRSAPDIWRPALRTAPAPAGALP